MIWQLQDTENRFGEMVEASLSEGPQVISQHGKNTAVLLSYDDYQRLIQKRIGVKKALMAIDISNLDLTRNKPSTRHAKPIEFN